MKERTKNNQKQLTDHVLLAKEEEEIQPSS